MKKGTKQFSLAASNAYTSKSLEENQELQKRCCELKDSHSKKCQANKPLQLHPPLSRHTVISLSPGKDEHSYWLRNLDLTFSDKLILQAFSWLNDSIIFAAQCLLREQSNGRIQGWKRTQCSKRTGEKFPCLPPNSAFVQVLHVAGSHWITTSNIDSRQNTHYRDTV